MLCVWLDAGMDRNASLQPDAADFQSGRDVGQGCGAGKNILKARMLHWRRLCEWPVQGPERKRWLRFYFFVLFWVCLNDSDAQVWLSNRIWSFRNWDVTENQKNWLLSNFTMSFEQFPSCPCNLVSCNDCINYSASFGYKMRCWIYPPPIQAYFHSCTVFSEIWIEGAVQVQSVWLFRSHWSILCSLF